MIAADRIGQMVEYRIYSIGSDGHFVKSECLECPSDEEAIKLTTLTIDTCDVELWSGARVVAKLHCNDPGRGAPGIPAAV
jgi:hypothetical protein